jgi:predicted transcriptional regulator
MKYRCRVEIIRAILKAAESSATKTVLMNNAYITFSQSHEYLDPLVDRKLLSYDELTHIYELTEKGVHLLHLMDSLDSLIDLPVESEGETVR